jgi:hypothetical protein
MKYLFVVIGQSIQSIGFAALGLVLFINTTYGQQAKTSTLERIKAAEEFAAKLAPPGSAQFNEFRKQALELAITPPLSPRVGGLTTSSSTRLSVEDDPRYSANLLAMVRGTTSGMHPRIFGGRLVPAARFPDVVSVQGVGGYCSGTLIAASVVLTAAHCHCDHANEKVVFGIDLETPDQVFDVKKSVPMKGCDTSQSGGDVALLFLDGSTAVEPRVLANVNGIASIGDVTAVGFGLTEKNTSGTKLMVDIPVASQTCSGTYKDFSDASYYGCVNGIEMVAGAQNLNKDTCRGDSGGPVFVRIANGDQLVAATSRGVQTPGAADCGDGGIYELIQGPILDWIRSTNAVPVHIAP